MRNRPGFTLPDVLVSLVVMGVIGASLAQVMTVQSRFYQKHEGRSQARAVSRSATNVIMSDLRMVETGGIVSATATSITIRVPYAFGVLCQSGDGSTAARYAMMMPADSVVKAETVSANALAGYAWRGSTGAYTYAEGGSTVIRSTATDLADPDLPATPGNLVCGPAGISTVVPGSWIALVRSTVPSSVPAGTPILLFQRMTYSFSSSVSVPGRIGLWRTVPGKGQAEEIVAPFDVSAAFRFYVDGSNTPQATVPSPLSTIRGLELQLTGINERAGSNNNLEERAPYTTAVFFKNRT